MNVQLFKNYTHQGLCRAIDVYNFPEEHPMVTRILSYRFLFQFGHNDRRLCPSKDKIISKLRSQVKYNIDNNNQENLRELVDILLDYSRKDGNELLTYLRNKQEDDARRIALQRASQVPLREGPKGTIYADTQSVHNTSITKTIKSVSKYLVGKYKPYFIRGSIQENEFKKSIHLKLSMNLLFKDNTSTLDTVLNRIYSDNTLFEGNQPDIIFFSLWNYVSSQNNEDLYNRVAEEVFGMHRNCSTRILSGIVNSIQGFTTDENLIIKMDESEQYKTRVYHYLDEYLKNTKDENLLDSMYEKSEYFQNHIRELINEKRIEWNLEYGAEFDKRLNKLVNTYADCEIFEDF